MLALGLQTLEALFSNRAGDWSIIFPTTVEMCIYSDLVHQRQPLLDGVFGFVDGLNLKVEESGDPDIQNAFYNGWLAGCYVSQVHTLA